MINMNIWIYNRLVLNVLLMMIILIMRDGGIMILYIFWEQAGIVGCIDQKHKKTTNILVWKTEKRESDPGEEHCFSDLCSESVSGWKGYLSCSKTEKSLIKLEHFLTKESFFGIMTKFIFWELSLIDVRMVILAWCLILHWEHWRWGKIKPL